VTRISHEFYENHRNRIDQGYRLVCENGASASEITEVHRAATEAMNCLDNCERHGTLVWVEAIFEPMVFSTMVVDESAPVPNPRQVTHRLEDYMRRFFEIVQRIANRLGSPQHPGDNGRSIFDMSPSIFANMGLVGDAMRSATITAHEPGQQYLALGVQDLLRAEGNRISEQFNVSHDLRSDLADAFAYAMRAQQDLGLQGLLQAPPPSPDSDSRMRFEGLLAQIHAARSKYDALGRKPTWRELRDLAEEGAPPGVIAAICNYFDLPVDSTLTGAFETAAPLREEYDEEELGVDTDGDLGMGEAETWFREHQEASE